jgi:hypothetical protein
MSKTSSSACKYYVLIGALLSAIAAPSVATSQASISITTLGGYLWIDPLLRYDEHFRGYYTDWHSRELLKFSNAPTFGARMELRRGNRWFGYLESVYASTRLTYTYETAEASVFPPGPPQLSGLIRWDLAKINTYEAGVGRRVTSGPMRVDLIGGGGVYQLRPKKSGGFCPVGVRCPDDRWQSTYNVPTLAVGFDLRTPAFHRLALELGAKGSVGRINTSGFSKTSPQNSFLYDPPTHRWVHTGAARLGLVLGGR